MFIKTIVKTDKKSGKRYEYLRLCESYRLGTKVRHRSIVTLGRVEELDTSKKKKALADRIEQLLRGAKSLFVSIVDEEIESLAQRFYTKIKRKQQLKPEQKSAISPNFPKTEEGKDFETIDINSVVSEDVREIGSEWLCFQTVAQLGLRGFLVNQGWEKKWIDTALIHLISKAVYPASEHKTEQWIKENSAIAELFSVENEKISRHHLYEVSRRLYKLKEEVEPFLSTKTNELFDLADKIILYDLTNTYFEGRKQGSQMAQYGRSKEKRSDAKLLALALVTNAEGFVKYSKIYKGNIADCKTLEKTVMELSSATTSSQNKPLVVIDAGISTDDNLKMLKSKGYDYLCVTRSKLKNYELVDANAPVLLLQDKRKNLIEIKSIKIEKETDSFLYVKSSQKAKKEASMEQRSHTRYEEELQSVAQALHKKGGTKKVEKVWERIGRIKQRHPSSNKHYTIKVQSEKGIATELTYTQKLLKARSTQGVYFLRSSKLIWHKRTFGQFTIRLPK